MTKHKKKNNSKKSNTKTNLNNSSFDKLFYPIIGLIIFLDQITKYLIITYLKQPTEIIKGIFQLNFVKNTGAGFSLFHNFENSNIYLAIFTIIIIITILFNHKKIDSKLKLWLAILVGGAIGNLIDRIRFGYVIDFLDFHVWPIFNIADSAITISGIIIIIYLIKNDKEERAKEK